MPCCARWSRPRAPTSAITGARPGRRSACSSSIACSCVDADAKPPIAVLTGPTGTGKSDIALRLAREFPFEIVSVDSAQVYRGLDIGSAKPDAETRAAVRHHLLDLVDANAVYSAGQFVRDATSAIADIEARGRVPLLVGGTMLYLRALIGGIATLPHASEQIRAEIDAEAM